MITGICINIKVKSQWNHKGFTVSKKTFVPNDLELSKVINVKNDVFWKGVMGWITVFLYSNISKLNGFWLK